MDKIFYNDISASKYEVRLERFLLLILIKEFEVVKINHRNKKQDRILGIDQYRIYNLVAKMSD